MNLRPNPRFDQLPDIKVDDFVYLIAKNAGLKLRVLSINNNEIIGVVRSIYDPNFERKLRGGTDIDLLDKKAKVKKRFVHFVNSGF